MAFPTGTVSIFSYTPGGNLIATTTVAADGSWSVTSNALTTLLTQGIPVYAVYGGDATHNPSTSDAVNDVVGTPIVDTVIILNISPNPANVGDTQTFSGTVSNK